MEIRFYGTPNMLVKLAKKKPYTLEIVHEPLFRFDSNGEYLFKSDDMKVIERLKAKFAYKENYLEFETENNAIPSEEIQTQANVRHCKKCEFTCTNQGDLMAHYREIHPKSKEDKEK